jgi:hypothetical protein
MMNEATSDLIPFHAINEFMRDDYRLHVVKTALSALPSLPDDIRGPLDRLIKRSVSVPGFRNSDKAPARMKAGPTAKAFTNSPEMTAAVLTAWSEVNSGLRQQVFELLTARGWSLLPLEADRRMLPGFFITWPKSEDFETLAEIFSEMYPDAQVSNDDINLMVVWVSTRLPYQMVEDEPSVVTDLYGEFEGDEGDDEEEPIQDEESS